MASGNTAVVRTIKKDVAFQWEGMDKKGQRLKGKSVAANVRSAL